MTKVFLLSLKIDQLIAGTKYFGTIEFVPGGAVEFEINFRTPLPRQRGLRWYRKTKRIGVQMKNGSIAGLQEEMPIFIRKDGRELQLSYQAHLFFWRILVREAQNYFRHPQTQDQASLARMKDAAKRLGAQMTIGGFDKAKVTMQDDDAEELLELLQAA